VISRQQCEKVSGQPLSGAEELITTERPTTPLFRVTGIVIKTITLPFSN
jgi:hypothetical protein